MLGDASPATYHEWDIIHMHFLGALGCEIVEVADTHMRTAAPHMAFDSWDVLRASSHPGHACMLAYFLFLSGTKSSITSLRIPCPRAWKWKWKWELSGGE